jgi:NitT/TauT family transport system substrate-binding protein
MEERVMRKWLAAAAALVGLQLGGPAIAQERVTLVLNWTPSGDHAPLYYAIQQGWYREAGVDVRLEIGRGSGASASRVGAGAEMGISDLGAVMVARGQGADLVAVMNIFANSPQGFYWLRSSGIQSVRDFAGRRLGNPPGDAARVMWPAIARRMGMDPGAVTWVNINPAAKPAALISRQVDGTTFFYNYHYIMQREMGADLGFASWRSLGLNLYGNSLIANGRFLREKPDAARAVTRVTQRAYLRCVEAPDPCVAAMTAAVSGIKAEEERQNWDLTVSALFDDDAFRSQAFGWFAPERVAADLQVVRETFELQRPFEPDAVATNALLDTSLRLPARRAN